MGEKMKNYSIWNEEQTEILPKISEDKKADILIIGGGLTGISLLYQLRNSNLKTILVEKNTCGRGVTSKSTAKITYLQDLLVTDFKDEQTASLYLKSQQEAIKEIKKIITTEKIDCDFEKSPSYLFTNDSKNIKKLEQQYTFLKKNHVAVKKEKLEKVLSKLSLKVEDTYLFHPLKYLFHLKEILKDSIYENSPVQKIQKTEEGYIALIGKYQISCSKIVIATHYPYFLKPLFFPLKNHVETSFIGVKKEQNSIPFSAISIDNPILSLRTYQNTLFYLIDSMPTGNIKNIENHFEKLKKIASFDYLWSNKDIITNDKIPYIGRVFKQDNSFLIACGYNTWGMTNASIAAVVLKDILLEKENPFEKLFDPRRSLNFKKVEQFPLDILYTGKAILKSTKKNTNNQKIKKEKRDGQSVLIYVDEKGKEHIVLNRCPHMKCGLVFNEYEKTWDCLCHGSKFDLDGKCIEGPSNCDITFPEK